MFIVVSCFFVWVIVMYGAAGGLCISLDFWILWVLWMLFLGLCLLRLGGFVISLVY